MVSCETINLECGWGPRALDLDLLTYGKETVKTETLELPHPRMTERAFVLVPLADIAPELEISGRGVAEWLADLDHGAIERIADADEIIFIHSG